MTAKNQVYDVLAIGISAVDDILMVAHYPPQGVKTPVLTTSRHGGGLACTAIAAAATLGGKTAFVGRLGDDGLSIYIRDILEKRGVDISHIVGDSTGQPYHSRIIIDQSTGERTIFYDERHFKPVQADDIPMRLLESSAVVLLDYIGGPESIDLVRKARKAHRPVVIDMEGRPAQAGPLLDEVDHLVVSDEFARWCSGQSSPGASCDALARTRRAATVVTAGAAGCWWTDRPDRPAVHVPAFAVRVVDTNGCGDTFHGAYALAIARNLSIAGAVLFASACAALKASGAGGGWNALPTASGVVELLRQTPGANDAQRDVMSMLQQMQAQSAGADHAGKQSRAL
ncbi:MAG: hypothetical protein HKL96_05370 [Phycisphaerales bacterium]|nr:hypothetical protein [Phycisphaerales bacterium]